MIEALYNLDLDTAEAAAAETIRLLKEVLGKKVAAVAQRVAKLAEAKTEQPKTESADPEAAADTEAEAEEPAPGLPGVEWATAPAQ
jgi:hypothetical protein